jgi:gluconate 2-dehydrogenase gamma chain
MDPISRRDLLVGGVVYGSSLWMLRGTAPARRAGGGDVVPPAVLTEASWRTVEAITARIIPTDDQPGAVEAGCTNFIDKALAHEDAALRPTYGIGRPTPYEVARDGVEPPTP